MQIVVIKTRNMRIDLSQASHDLTDSETFEKCPHAVIPAKAGIQKAVKILDSRLHGNDNFIPFTEKFKGL
jgi:hypothetical protein